MTVCRGCRGDPAMICVTLKFPSAAVREHLAVALQYPGPVWLRIEIRDRQPAGRTQGTNHSFPFHALLFERGGLA